MNKVKYILFLLLFSLSFSFAKENSTKKNISILLEKNITEALLEVRGPYYIFDPYDGSKINSGIMEKRFMVRPTSSGIKWGQEFLVHQMLIVPRSKQSSILLNGIQYDGALAIYKVNNKMHIVNQTDVESYIKSLLTSQFTYALEKEAMASVAITARTTAYFQVENNQNSFWHVEKDKIGYEGSSLIVDSSDITKAVNGTKNLILVNSKDGKAKPFSAVWTDHCAGKTAPFHTIFRKEANAPKEIVEAPLAALGRNDAKWSYKISIEKLSNLFEFQKINAIKLFQDQNSKKTYAIRLTENDKTIDLDFLTFQNKLNKNNLKSNDFTAKIEANKVYFEGYGKGHGVGLCLYSAFLMAQNGDNAVKILSKFFPNTYITNTAIFR